MKPTQKRPPSILEVIREANTRAKLYALGIFLALIFASSAGLLRYSHTAVCALIETRLEGMSGPLARELMLSDQQTSQAIFSDLRKTLTDLGASNSLVLDSSSNLNLSALSDSERACTPGVLSAQVSYPIRLGDQLLAVIHGRVSYFSVVTLAGILAFAVLLWLIATWILSQRIDNRLTSSLIDPIRNLSRGLPWATSEGTPAEVLEIETNIRELKATLQERERLNASLLRSKELADLAAQVSHNIRSPLAALKSLSVQVQSLDQDSRDLLSGAVNRIRDTANELLRIYRNQSSPGVSEPAPAVQSRPNMLLDLVESIVSEKRVQYAARGSVQILNEWDASAYGLFTAVSQENLKSALSNLLDNAVEALANGGRVTLALKRVDFAAEITISDNGKGIPSEILPRLGQQGATFGKENGTGLGLYYAKTLAESHGGYLEIESKQDEGTRITFKIPEATPPAWFASGISLRNGGTVCVIDDDPSIHAFWKKRLEAHSSIEIRSFSRSEDFKTYLSSSDARPPDQTVYLCDQELSGSDQTGLDLIRSLGLASRAVLVTSRYWDNDTQKECEALGLRMIPKASAWLVPLELSRNAIDCVLIDDDPMIHLTWKMGAKQNQKTILTFSKPDEFWNSSSQIDLSTPIYIDSALANKQKGEKVAKELFDKGYSNLFLATGHAKDSFAPMPWIRDITGKEFPLETRRS